MVRDIGHLMYFIYVLPWTYGVIGLAMKAGTKNEIVGLPKNRV
jgi:hypothetical protein